MRGGWDKYKLNRSFAVVIASYEGLFHAARLLPGAVHLLYLINNDLTLQQVSYLAQCFTFTLLLASYPIGRLSNKLGSKICILFACLFLCVSNLIYLYFVNFSSLVIAQVLLGIGLVITSVSFPAWLNKTVELESAERKSNLNKLTLIRNEIQAVGSIIFGMMGAFIAVAMSERDYGVIYLLTALLIAFLGLSLSFIPYPKPTIPLNAQPTEMVKSRPWPPQAKYFIILHVFLTCSYQPLYYFWQAIIQESNKYANFNITMLAGVCLTLYNLSIFFTSFLSRKKFIERFNTFKIAIVSSFISFLLFLSFSFELKSPIINILTLSVLHALLALVYSIQCGQILRLIPGDLTARFLGLAETYARLASILFLWFIGWASNSFSIAKIYAITSIFLLFMIITFWKWMSLTFKP